MSAPLKTLYPNSERDQGTRKIPQSGVMRKSNPKTRLETSSKIDMEPAYQVLCKLLSRYSYNFKDTSENIKHKKIEGKPSRVEWNPKYFF